jgi:hypothetical protein
MSDLKFRIVNGPFVYANTKVDAKPNLDMAHELLPFGVLRNLLLVQRGPDKCHQSWHEQPKYFGNSTPDHLRIRITYIHNLRLSQDHE